MSRIRSIHPGLWTDDAFMALSAHARLLVIGLWTEAYDDGVFEWKPLTIKARVFPADSVDVPALLEELVGGSFIRREEFDGKPLGLIRNFREFQRPKTPNSSAMLRDEWRTYVGLSAVTSEPLENRSGNDGGKVPQMEDGGGKMKEEDRTSPPAIDTEGARVSFDEVLKAYPHNPLSSEPEAETAFNATKASERPVLLAAALRFRQWFTEDNEARDRTEDAGARYVKPLSTWISSGKWREAASLPLKADREKPSPDLAVIKPGTPEFEAITRHRHGNAPFVGQSGGVTVRKTELAEAMAAA